MSLETGAVAIPELSADAGRKPETASLGFGMLSRSWRGLVFDGVRLNSWGHLPQSAGIMGECGIEPGLETYDAGGLNNVEAPRSPAGR